MRSGTGLSPAIQALFERRLRDRSQATAIPHRVDPGAAPLSYAQERLWFFEQLGSGSAAYNRPLALHLRGPLDLAPLQQALGEILRRHEVLRAAFPAVDGRPVARIAAPAPFALAQRDVRDLGQGEPLTVALHLAREEARRPFDLARGPLCRGLLLRLGAEEHLLLLTFHHAVFDGWSATVLLRELAALYEAFAAGRPSPLPDLAIQYADYAVWQRDRALAGDLAFWQQHLTGPLPALGLPTDHPRPAVQSLRGASKAAELGRRLTGALEVLARREGATLFMLLAAAFAALLHRYSAQEDIVIGTPVAGRTQLETEGLIGCLINTLALRTDLSGDPTFRELLRRVRRVALEAYAHQELPFEKVVEALQPERHLSRMPLFQVMFNLRNLPPLPTKMGALSIEVLELDMEAALFDLSLEATRGGAGLRCRLIYDTALFEPGTAHRLLAHYRTLLEGVLANPDARLSALPLLTPPERRRLLVEWNATEASFPAELGLQPLFEEQVRRAPGAVALAWGGSRLTYRELNARANRLAHHLLARGVGPDLLVATYLERSFDLVVALLAIAKAGAAYVPLDPAYPTERLGLMLADSQAPVILAQESLLPNLPEVAAEVICLDAQREAVSRESAEDPPCRATGESLAYVIYTSGSTGRPKGVAVPQRAVSRLVINADYVRLEPSDAVAQVSNASFDAATFEIWGALLNGARLVLIDRDIALSPREFAAALRRQAITTLFLTTALLNLLAREAPGAFTTLRHLLFGGEAVDSRWVRQVLHDGPPQRLLHVYGPTEATTFACWYPVQAVPEDATTVPIGRPIANTQLYVLDEHRNPVPVGVPGELYIGGPALTAERFVPNPFALPPSQGEREGSRLYRTGDRVRYLPNGNLEFLGRLDAQVKIRGYRVEPGEVEALLAQHPAVGEAAVVAREDSPGERRLTAYAALQPGQTATAGDLRAFLKEKLPRYMLPTAIVLLKALPLNPNGKVDRQALPSPGPALLEPEDAGLSPRDALEQQLASIWARVLGLPAVGVRDDFFDLGGHSLLAVRLFAEIEKETGHSLPLATLFQAPTVEALAAALRQEGWKPPWSSLMPLQLGGKRPPLYIVHAYGGGVSQYRPLAQHLGADQPVYGLLSIGIDGRQSPLTSVEEMAAHYVREIRSFQPEGPYYVGGHSFGGVVAFEIAQRLVAQGERVALLALLDTARPGLRKRSIPSKIRFHLETLSQLEPGERSSYLVRKAVNKVWKLSCRLFPAMRSRRPRILENVRDVNEEAFHSYVAQPCPGRVTLFWADKLDRSDRHRDSLLGWKPLAAGGVEVCNVPGDHVSIMDEPDVRALARELRQSIDEALAAETSRPARTECGNTSD